MQVFMHPDLELSANALIDASLGVRYELTTDAAWLAKELRREPCVEDLVPVFARHQGVNEADAQRALYQFMGLLDVYGGIRITWDQPLRLFDHFKMSMVWRTRYQGTWSGFVRSVTRAYWLWLVCLTLMLGCMQMFAKGELASVWLMMPAIALMTCVIHEAGHAAAAKIAGVPFVFLARSAGLAILYRTPEGWRARFIAGCGPALAVVFCGACWATNNVAALRFVCTIAAGLHAASLLPFLADGKTIWRKL